MLGTVTVDQAPREVEEPGLQALDFLWLEITNRCNLSCSHCYAKSGPYEPESYGLNEHDWLRILNEARDLGCQAVQFIGGEPLLHPSLSLMLREARRLRYKTIEVFTNATRISDDWLKLFLETGVCLATSFYSTDVCAHDSITRVRGSQQKPCVLSAKL